MLQEKLDTERGRAPGHNNLLYRIWNEKTNMMKIVSVGDGRIPDIDFDSDSATKSSQIQIVKEWKGLMYKGLHN